MANKFRFRHGQKELRLFPVEADVVIERGDLVWADIRTNQTFVQAASDFTWSSNLATTQGNFAALFVGVAQDPSPIGDSIDINVDVSPYAVYAFDCPAAQYKITDTLGPDEGTTDLQNQQLEKAVAASSIARVVTATGAGATEVEVTLHSAYNVSNNINANIG